jgi:hypothetical protein
MPTAHSTCTGFHAVMLTLLWPAIDRYHALEHVAGRLWQATADALQDGERPGPVRSPCLRFIGVQRHVIHCCADIAVSRRHCSTRSSSLCMFAKCVSMLCVGLLTRARCTSGACPSIDCSSGLRATAGRTDAIQAPCRGKQLLEDEEFGDEGAAKDAAEAAGAAAGQNDQAEISPHGRKDHQ